MMNLNQYKVKTRYLPTKRLRTISLWALTEDDARRRLSEEPQFADYSEIKSITLSPSNKPYPDKVNYAISLGIKVTPDMSNDDVSALISRRLDDKREPNSGLKDFATSHYIPYSLYIGKKSLYNKVFYNLDTSGRIAFFIFSVYRYLSNDREANLDKSPYRNLFYQKAYEWKDNAPIVKSLDSNYNGEDLRFFGTISFPGGHSAYGGSRSTLIYKKTVQFLLDERLISEMDTHRVFSPINEKNKPTLSSTMVQPVNDTSSTILPSPYSISPESNMSPSSNNPKSHRKLFIILGIIFIILLIAL